jgi:hypothetical protein
MLNVRRGERDRYSGPSYDFSSGAGSAAGDLTLLDKSDGYMDLTDGYMDLTKDATRELGEFLLTWVNSRLILATTLRGG